MTAAQASGVRPKRLIVYQLLGKLETYRVTRYRVGGSGREVESCFSSVAIADHYAFDQGISECEIRFFAPISLISPRTDSNGFLDLEVFREKIDAWIRRVEKDVRWRAEIVPLPAFGSYKPEDGDQTVWTYNATLGSVAAAALVDMLRSTHLIRERDQEVHLVLNVSTGHNSYIPSLIEALKALLVLDGALSLGKGGVVVDACYAAVDAMRQEPGSVLNVYLLKTSAKFFIDYPFEWKDIGGKNYTLKELCRESANVLPETLKIEARPVLKRTNKVLVKGLKAFNAFRYGAPLALLDRRLISLDSQEALGCAEEVLSLVDKILRPTVSGTVISVPYVDFNQLRSLLIAFAIAAAISSKVSELGDFDPQRGVPLETLERFSRLYEDLPELKINSRLLSKELLELKTLSSEVSSTSWQKLKTLREQREAKSKEGALRKERPSRDDEKSEGKGYPQTSDEKRNFYAHAGLSRNEVEVMKEGEKILLRYNEDRIPVIKNWLLEP
ncbi:MAG: hypothetical protein NYU90_02715 [Aigarchaeota archaeon]|nr:hypothetical protein [Candidatus Calditenuis fumarioli]